MLSCRKTLIWCILFQHLCQKKSGGDAKEKEQEQGSRDMLAGVVVKGHLSETKTIISQYLLNKCSMYVAQGFRILMLYTESYRV